MIQIRAMFAPLLLVLGFLVAMPALAQAIDAKINAITATRIISPEMMATIIYFLVIALLLPAIGALFTLVRWLISKVKNDRLRGWLFRVESIGEVLVRSAAQTTVRVAKSDGRWDAQVASDVKTGVMSDLKAHLGGTDALAKDAKALGIDNVDALLSATVEALVHKIDTPAVAAVVTTATTIAKAV